MTDMVFGSAAARGGEPELARWWRSVDRWSLAAVICLFLIGILLALAASVPLAEDNGKEPYYYVILQGGYGAVALLAMVALSLMPPLLLRRLGVLAFAGGLVALALLPLLGTDFGKGSVRWYSLGFTSVQPAEFVKPAFIVFAAWLMSASFDLRGPPGKFLSFVAAGLVAGLLVVQPDYGQTALILASWGAMYFVAGASLLLLVGLVGLAIGGGALAYTFSSHFAGRIDGYLLSEVDPTSQLGFATDAIREGGLFGVGIGEGVVKSWLPDAHTDFIIAVAVEEFGILFAFVIVVLFLTVVIRSLRRLVRERDPFLRLAGTGLAVCFGIQAFINISVAVRLLPAKGMTLPFVSYGGSSLVASGIAIGLLLAFTRRRPQDELAEALSAGRQG